MKNKKHLFIITSTLPLTYGGRTNSLLQRARLLTENKTPIKKVTLATCNYNPNYNEIYKDYREKGTVNNKIDFINMYDWFKASYQKDKLKNMSFPKKLKKIFSKKTNNNYKTYIKNTFGNDTYEMKRKKSSPITYYYKDGILIYHLSYNIKENRMGHIDVYSGYLNHPKKRMYMNDEGNFHKIRYYKDQTKHNIIRDVFVDENMNTYFTREFYYEKDILKTKKDILFKPDGSTKTFKTETDLFAYWFNLIFKDGNKIISDARVLDGGLLQIDKNVTRFFQAHGPHLHSPSKPNPKIKKGFDRLSKKIEAEDDYIITLTEGQKVDMIERYPRLENKIKVIPHCMLTNSMKVNYQNVIPKKISIISRLVPIKRIDHAIKAFSEFLKERPGYTLDIYGTGEELSNLKKLTKKLKLNNNVTFKGFTDNPHDIFQKSEFTLLTSKFEGLGLTILESIVNGCPVISYDIKWGPNEIIESHNGILVEDGNLEELKKAMIFMADNPFDRKKVVKIDKKFTKKQFLKEWTRLLK